MDIQIKDYKIIFISAKYLWITKAHEKSSNLWNLKSSHRPIFFPFVLKEKFSAMLKAFCGNSIQN